MRGVKKRKMANLLLWTVDIKKTTYASAQANSITIRPLESTSYSVPYSIWAVYTSLMSINNAKNFSIGTFFFYAFQCYRHL